MPSDPIVPVRSIPLSVPDLSGNEGAYLAECVRTNWVSSAGPFVTRFEQAVATFVDLPHAVATVTGTAALHIALIVAGVEPDDEVLVSTLSFIAPANAIRYVGAWPVFVDAEPSAWQMDVELVRDFLERDCSVTDGIVVNNATGRRVRAVLPVHILGSPVDMDPLLQLAREYGLAVVEDATESLGATYHGRPVGALGDIACFSFNGNKLITAGGGGMIVTQNKIWASRARYLTTQAKDDPVEYVHGDVGYNYRLTNLQAALACAQMERIDAFLEAKRVIAGRYNAALADVSGIEPMREPHDANSAWWLYTVRVNMSGQGDARGLMRALEAVGIQTRPLWQPLHASKPHAGAGLLGGAVAERLYEECLSLPCSVGLTEEDQERTIEAISTWRLNEGS